MSICVTREPRGGDDFVLLLVIYRWRSCAFKKAAKKFAVTTLDNEFDYIEENGDTNADECEDARPAALYKGINDNGVVEEPVRNTALDGEWLLAPKVSNANCFCVVVSS